MGATIPQSLAGDIDRLAALFEDTEAQDQFVRDIASHIRNALEIDLVAIFVHDAESGSLVFRAGADPDGIWDRAHCKTSEGGRHFSIERSVVGRAFSESRVVRWTAEGDEQASESDAIGSKLIVPMARGTQQVAVLVLADRRRDTFDELSDLEVMRLASRFGDLLEDGSLLVGSLSRSETVQREVKGQRASGGATIGSALLFWSAHDVDATPHAEIESAEAELAKFDAALELSLAQLTDLADGEASGLSEVGSLIFGAHLLMLRDRSFTGRMRERITEGSAAVAAIRHVVEYYADRFSAMSEVRIAEKAHDVRDLGYRLVTNLDASGGRSFSWSGRIALARHIYPSELARLTAEGVAGVVLYGATVTAHISILASSLGIPVLITDDRSLLKIRDGALLILDADGASLLIDPPDALREEWEHRIARRLTAPRALHIRGKTSDDHHVMIAANVNIVKDAIEARGQGAEGIGLYRSEFPFILKNDFISEEQQYHIYRSVVMSHRGKPVDLRTADLGGDKLMQGRVDREDNPFLGVRGIRFSLANREMFGEQLRAMLRAGHGADLGIMIPMVSGVEELLDAKEEIRRAAAQLAARGVAHNTRPRVGAMIELPSAALASAELAAEADFLSIGTNDLTMYLLAVDRTNEHLGHLYRTYHPSVLRSLKFIVDEARGVGDDSAMISVCGDAAADPLLMLFFVGIGIRKLSVAPPRIESLKRRLAGYTLDDARRVADELLSIRRIPEMDAYLATWNAEEPRESLPESLISVTAQAIG
ncbi:MAG: phosphoenolpyruvate--protein phosphotransferase [Spirochaetales bacterium]|nr:phosphoenolpyruvate--protein phosphotransferase [Spirochaetales bacterium]